MPTFEVYLGGLFVTAAREEPHWNSVYSIGVDARRVVPRHSFRVLYGIDAQGKKPTQVLTINGCDIDIGGHDYEDQAVEVQPGFNDFVVPLSALDYGALKSGYLAEDPAQTVALGKATARLRLRGGALTVSGSNCKYGIGTSAAPPTAYDIDWASFVVWQTEVPEDAPFATLRIKSWTTNYDEKWDLDTAKWPSGRFRLGLVNEPVDADSETDMEHYRVLTDLTGQTSTKFPFLEPGCNTGPGGSPATCPGTKDP